MNGADRGTGVARAVVLAGDGVVARFPGILCVARCPDTEPLRRLLGICREVAGPEPGRALARRLAMWLGGTDAPPQGLEFGTVAVAGDLTAVFLSGAVGAQVGDVTVSGADAAAWADRLVAHGPVRLALDGATEGPLAALCDLREGVVTGGGVELGAAPAAAPVAAPPAAAQPAARSATPVAGGNINAQPTLVGMEPVEGGTDPAVPVSPVALAKVPVVDVDGTGQLPRVPAGAAPRRADAILGVAPSEPPRPPLEAGEPAGTGTRSASGGPATGGTPAGPKPGEARGHLCSRGHLNDPRSHFCVLCGIRMNERTGVLVIGSRPPLGLLVFDDGATYTVDAEYLVGRMPESDDRVRSGTLRSIVVEDRSGAVSRVHAEVRVDGWDVVLVDSGSRNGTFVAAAGDPAWSPVPPTRSCRLVPGMRVRMGGRTFVFESPSGVR
ncbi:FHA domain-containing protein [Pseudonocardia saturnea]